MDTAGTEPGERWGSFGVYHETLVRLTADLKRLAGICDRLHLPGARALVAQALRSLTEDRFQVAVVGEFKRGKSTFLNALLGREILPADILPCSATLNRVTYGLTPEVRVRFKDGREEAVEVERLADYVTKLTEASERTAAQVAEAVVRYPVAYCRHGVDLIDTPGLNDDAAMTEVTLSVLPRVDAAILVIMAQSPLSEFERDFLERKLLASDLGRVLFVVTAIDRCESPEEADRLLQHIGDRIRKYVLQRAERAYGAESEEFRTYQRKIGNPRVFGVSSRQALKAKATGDAALLAASRFEGFEAALERILTEERGAVLLQAPLNRILSAGNEVVCALDVQLGSADMDSEQFRAACAAAESDLEALRARRSEELERIDQATQRLRTSLQPLFGRLERDLINAAEAAVDAFPLDPGELNRDAEKIQSRLADQVTAAIEETSRRFAEQVQVEVERALASEVHRLQAFSDEVAGALNRIRTRFVEVRTAPKDEQSTSRELIAAAVAVYTGFGGIWSGYREAGLAGAATGALASYGTFLGAGVLTALLGLPFTWPAVIAVGVLSIFTGGLVTRAVFGRKQVADFKQRCKAELARQIGDEFRNSAPRELIDGHIRDTFATLRERVREEVDAQLDDTQGKLAELVAGRRREETLAEAERAELEELQSETLRMMTETRALLDRAASAPCGIQC